MIHNALKISAKKIIVGGLPTPRLRMDRIIGGVAIGKAFRYDLVKDGFLCPLRGSVHVILVNIGEIIITSGRIRLIIVDTELDHPGVFIPRSQAKAIGKSFISRLYMGLPVI